MRLFDDFIRTDFSYSAHSESTYSFYNRAALPEFAAVRNRLEKWFSAYPDEAKFELKRKFEKNEFDSAYYELFLYTLFIKNGYSVELHPNVAASTKRPDLLVSKGDFSAYVEARVVHEVSVNEANLRNLKNRIYDKINEIQSDYFCIGIEDLDILDMSKAPSLREINDFIKDALSQVDPQTYSSKSPSSSQHLVNYPTFSMGSPTIRLTISVLPKPPHKVDERPIMIGYRADEGKAQIVNPSAALTKALKEKGRRYGTLDRPFIIAINALSTWATYEEDYTIALFGKETLAFDPTNRVYLSAQNSEGFFIDAKGFTYSRVSGVLFTKAYHSSVAGSRLVFYHNPAATIPVETDFLEVEQKFMQEGSLITIGGKTTAEVFNSNDESAE